jgi:hypothetical protein
LFGFVIDEEEEEEEDEEEEEEEEVDGGWAISRTSTDVVAEDCVFLEPRVLPFGSDNCSEARLMSKECRSEKSKDKILA